MYQCSLFHNTTILINCLLIEYIFINDLKFFERIICENFDNNIERFANTIFDVLFEIDFIV